MRLNVMLEAQEGLSYAQILAVARRAEEQGFAGFYRSDHYSSVAGREGLPSTDAWATLAGLARETEQITLGTMVSPATFRRAGNLAKLAATVAEMAGSVDGQPRVHLGMGTGWLEVEHRMHGFPFEDVATRFRRLGEHLQVVRGLWDHDIDSFTFDGEFERLINARFAPKPDPTPRIVVGGSGRTKTPRLTARHADELNSPFQSPASCREIRAALDRACETEARDPVTVAFSVMTACLVGADDRDFRVRAERLHARSRRGLGFDEWLDGLQEAWIVGTPERAADRIGQLADAGVEAVMLQLQQADDLDMLDVVMQEIAPRVGA